MFGVFGDGEGAVGYGEVALGEGELDELHIGLAEMGQVLLCLTIIELFLVESV